MADINPDSIPFVPPATVTLIDTSTDTLTGQPGGKPTTAFHDWMQALWDWMKRSVVDLTTKITTLTADIGDLSADIVEEATIRQTQDGILAAQVTTVSATANNALGLGNAATATGQVYLAAKAGPAGTAASYGWYLTAGSAFAGMEAMALSGGGSAIGFTADKFQFTDSGTATPVFVYSSGVWVFNVPIVIRSGTSGQRTEIDSNGGRVYDSAGTLRVRWGIW